MRREIATAARKGSCLMKKAPVMVPRPPLPAPGHPARRSGFGDLMQPLARLAAGAFVCAATAMPAHAQTSPLPVLANLPPKRPAVVAASEVTEPSRPALPIMLAATTAAPAGTAATPAAVTPIDQRAVIERANAFFNGVTTLTADFVQVGGDGRRLAGKLYLSRPGKMRFDYDAPATLEVIADGSSVAVRDSKLATQDLYPLSQTPLKFLTRDRIDLARDVKLTSVSSDTDGVRIALEDSTTLGGTSRITLTFDAALENLTRWRIVDPQGYQTNVTLTNLDKNRRIDNRLFVINYERMLDESKK